jgi:hypothetical protein
MNEASGLREIPRVRCNHCGHEWQGRGAGPDGALCVILGCPGLAQPALDAPHECKHRHTRTWLLSAGKVRWCEQCGAIEEGGRWRRPRKR